MSRKSWYFDFQSTESVMITSFFLLSCFLGMILYLIFVTISYNTKQNKLSCTWYLSLQVTAQNKINCHGFSNAKPNNISLAISWHEEKKIAFLFNLMYLEYITWCEEKKWEHNVFLPFIYHNHNMQHPFFII